MMVTECIFRLLSWHLQFLFEYSKTKKIQKSFSKNLSYDFSRERMSYSSKQLTDCLAMSKKFSK